MSPAERLIKYLRELRKMETPNFCLKDWLDSPSWHFSDQLDDIADMLYKYSFKEEAKEMLDKIINKTHYLK
jgi:hypothetical protein